jgi:hypothetical protein
MPGSEDYRKYVEKCFGTIDEKLDMVIDQMTKANHRVNKLEDKANERQVIIDDFRHLEKDYGYTKTEISIIKADLEDYRFFKKHPTLGVILITVFVIGMTLSTFQTVKSITGSNKNDEIIDRVKAIEYTLLDKLGVSPVTRGGIVGKPMDSTALKLSPIKSNIK